jgi:hypothetical protein
VSETPTTAVTVVPTTSIAKPSFYDQGPAEMIKSASEIASALAQIIDKQKLYTLVQGKKYVRYEGWLALGSIIGILPKEELVIELPDGSYEAKVQLLNFKNGLVVGGASAICSIDEKRWGNADKFARRSMAITRATGKAYRLTLGWIMPLAGYEPTPLEDMPDSVIDRKPTGSLYNPKDETHRKAVISIAAKAGFSLAETNLDEMENLLAGKTTAQLMTYFNKDFRGTYDNRTQ